jgi:hypothetical protein
MLPPQQKFDMLADALANVSAAYLARAIGAQPVVDTADLMAVERWEDISAAMQFSQTDLAVTDRSYLQNTRHVLATALSTFTPGVVLETHRNDRASQAEAVLIGRDVDRPILMGSIDEVDVDHYAFELGEGATLHLNLGDTSSGAKVELLDSDYAVVAEDTDADGRITRSLDAGLYYVRLTAAIDPLAPMSGAMLPAGSDALPPQSQSQYLMTMGQLGDATGDGLVNMFDFLAVRQNWLKPADSDRDDRADLNGDGLVNMFDFLAVRQNWLSQLPLSQQPQVPGDSLAPLAIGGQIDVLGSAVSAPPVSGSTGQRQTSTAAEVDLLGGPTREAVAAHPVGATAQVPVARSARPLEPIAPADAERIESGSYVPTGGTGVARGEDSSEELGSPLEDVLARLGS